MSISRPSVRIRFIAASSGALALVGTLALSGVIGEGVEMSEAAWTDKEVASATVSASWMNRAFARVNHGSWLLNKQGAPSDAPRTDRGGIFEFTASVTDTSSPSFQIANSENTPSIVPARTTTDDIWLGRYTTTSPIPSRALVDYCIDYPSPSSPGATTTCGNSLNASRLAARQHVSDSSLSIMGEVDRRARINVGGATTAVRCFEDGTTPTATATIPSRFATAREEGTTSANFGSETPISSSDIVDSSSNANDGFLTNSSGQKIWHRANIGFTGSPSSQRAFVLFISPRANTYVAPEGNYARAEIDLEIQVYSSGFSSFSGGTYRGSINYVISRSECGTGASGQSPPTQVGTFYSQPRQPTWTAPLFSGALTDAASGPFVPLNPEIIPAGLKSKAVELDRQSDHGDLPSTITATSTLEDSTASETTTSAPPDPSGEDTMTTAGTTPTRSTSTTTATSKRTATATKTATTTTASPAIVIPSDPGTLSTTAQTQTVGTVQVDGDALDVVVKGDTVPTGTRTALTALDTWINESTRPSGDWRTFTSSEPDSDGWRWAAINRETGTVVYIR